jgi:arginyl-tRNA synthetase
MQINQKLTTAINEALSKLSLENDAEVSFERPNDLTHGDFSTNIAMVMFGQLSDERLSEFSNPHVLAEKIVAQIKIPAELITDVTVAGPGFINFKLSEQYLLEELARVITNSDQLISPINSGKKAVVEFTDPNPFKQFHIGHLYSNTVGESVCRLLEATGATVRRANYFGDVGMHVAKSIWGMREKILYEKEGLIGETLESLNEQPISDRAKFLGESYAMGATSFKENEKVTEQIGQLNKLLYVISQDIMVAEKNWQPIADYKQHLDKVINENWNYDEVKLLYQTGKDWSMAYFEAIYDRVGMSFDNYYPESVVAEYGLEIVQQGLKKGVFVKSKGAVVYEGEEHGLHTRVFINSTGLPTYETKELGLAPAKQKDGEHDFSVIITGNEIDEYFQVLLSAMGELEPELREKTTHIGHGMVRLPSGKMSSRTGEIVTGEWLLDEAAARISVVLKDSKKDFSSDDSQEISEKVGQAAIKYAFLKSNIGKDIAFDFEESLSLDGNSGPYVQYAFTRCQSVLAKAEQVKEGLDQSVALNSSERLILGKLVEFDEVIQRAAGNLAPHYVCTYLFELAALFNSFYNQHQILNAKSAAQKQLRVQLTQATASVLGMGLGILGIETLDKM